MELIRPEYGKKKEPHYSKRDLVDAQIRVNQAKYKEEYADNPDPDVERSYTHPQRAQKQIEDLLSLVKA